MTSLLWVVCDFRGAGRCSVPTKSRMALSRSPQRPRSLTHGASSNARGGVGARGPLLIGASRSRIERRHTHKRLGIMQAFVSASSLDPCRRPTAAAMRSRTEACESPSGLRERREDLRGWSSATLKFRQIAGIARGAAPPGFSQFFGGRARRSESTKPRTALWRRSRRSPRRTAGGHGGLSNAEGRRGGTHGFCCASALRAHGSRDGTLTSASGIVRAFVSASSLAPCRRPTAAAMRSRTDAS